MRSTSSALRHRVPRPADIRRLTGLTLTLALMAAASDLPAQDRTDGSGFSTPSAISRDAKAFARRVGLWASVGGGRGSAGLQCAACTARSEPAFMAHLAVGGRVRERFHVGVETWAYLDVIGNGVDRTARGTQVIARHYPMASRALFVTGGAGTSRFSVDDGDARFHAAAPALSIGLGWDVPMRGVVLSPQVHLVASTGGALTSERTGNSVADNARLGLWRSTVAITWF